MRCVRQFGVRLVPFISMTEFLYSVCQDLSTLLVPRQYEVVIHLLVSLNLLPLVLGSLTLLQLLMYLVTLAALGEVFEAARGIMSWLGDCAKVIACENQAVCWTTPLGLPVVQPYCKTERYQIRTSLQLLALQREGSAVSVKKQRSAFPPNFVHSLDSSHMMMTALACNDVGLCFAGVHDSFWTHPCDVEKMNQILREKFVDLYNMPILENLLEGFQTTYPGLAFPSLPKRGEFDLEKVLDSPYFFN